MQYYHDALYESHDSGREKLVWVYLSGVYCI